MSVRSKIILLALLLEGASCAGAGRALADYSPVPAGQVGLPPGCNADILQAILLSGQSASGFNLTGGGTGNISSVIGSGNPSGVSAAAAANGQSVIYTAADGTQYTQSGGSLAWRDNNPGNLVYNSYTASLGAVGSNGNFAVFPDAQTGLAAQATLLSSSSYQSLSVNGAIAKYAPAIENDTAGYQSFITNTLGVSGSTTLSQLNASQMSSLQSAIVQHEGYIAGTTTQL